MYRATLVIVSITLLALVQSAPMPFYTQSFVQTPTSRVSQYLIMPDRNKPYRVPVSHVHHYSDFQVPRQQLVYYNPDGNNQYSLHEMKKEHPVMQQMMKDLQVSEQEMVEEMMKTSTDTNMMEKLKRDDGIMAEMMDALKETSTTDVPKTFSDAIVVADESGDVKSDESNEIPQANIELVKLMLENSGELLRNPEVVQIMKRILENNEEAATTAATTTTTTTVHPLMTQVLDNATPSQTQTNEELMEMLRNNQVSEETMTRIAALLANVDQVTTEFNNDVTESSTTRVAKTFALEIVEETKTQPEIQLRLVENTQEEELMATSTEAAQNDDATTEAITESIIRDLMTSTEQPQSENSSTESDELPSSTAAVIAPESSTTINLNVMEMSRMELIRSMLQSVGFLEQNLSLMQRINTDVSENTSSADVTEEVAAAEMTTEVPRVESTEASRVEMEVVTTEAPRTEITSTTATEVESTRAILTTTTRAEESTSQEAVVNDASEATTERAIELTTERVEESTVVQILQSLADEPSARAAASEELIASEEISSELESSSSESENSSEETTAAPQRVNTRQGRVNSAPTIFLHNNRFYVVSGAPDFYANFDAFQSPRTPIFSLQELQPIRPIDENTAVQRIEPFRISVEESNNNSMAGTQNDNEREENEPLKLQSGSQDSRADTDIVRSMEGRMDMEQRQQEQQREEVKKQNQDRQPAGEVERDLSEESSVAQANPSGIAIAGRGGVASSRPSGTALTGNNGLAVASPQATAVAGLSDFEDEDRKRMQLRRLRRVRKY